MHKFCFQNLPFLCHQYEVIDAFTIHFDINLDTFWHMLQTMEFWINGT